MSTPTATPRTDAALYPMNGVEIVWPDFARTLETELAEAKAEAAHYMSVAQKATDDLTRLRAELKELSQAYELNRVSIDELDADRARAERAEAALAKWSVLNLWGGTPEIIHEFIKGQQNRIHHCQDLEAECLEQARLLGMSGEREADLLGKIVPSSGIFWPVCQLKRCTRSTPASAAVRSLRNFSRASGVSRISGCTASHSAGLTARLGQKLRRS